MLFSAGILRYTPAAMSANRLRNGLFYLAMALAAGCSVPQNKVRVPETAPLRLSQTGIASWYGPGFHGKATASGDIYNQNDFTAAHQTLPLGTRVMVTNLENGSSTEVLINDRGPFAKGRIIDLSHSAAQMLSMVGPGTALVRVDVIESPIPLKKIPDAVDYTLQLGSFAQLENARQLRDRAARSFPQVRITPLRSQEVTYYRVHLGSFTDRRQAEDEARQVAQAGFSVVIMER